MEDLSCLFNRENETYIVGDLNICSISEGNHEILKSLESYGFQERVKTPTHAEGRQIDHVLQYTPPLKSISCPIVLQFGQYFSDHDLLKIELLQVL